MSIASLKTAYTSLLWLSLLPLSGSITTGLPGPPGSSRAASATAFTATFTGTSAAAFTASSIAF